MRRASSLSSAAMAFRILPKPSWVLDFLSVGRGSAAGIATTGASVRRRPAVLNGAAAMKACNSSGLAESPANLSHSWPSSIVMPFLKLAIWSSVIRPEWLSLWPAKGRPWPLMV